MKSTLVIIRGNSGSGKSTVAKKLQQELGSGVLRVPQDEIRLDMFGLKDLPENHAIGLIGEIAKYGKGKSTVVIMEGILATARYLEMLQEVAAFFDWRVLSYYFDLSFEETLQRHRSREKSADFGEEALRRWWLPHDVTGFPNEKLINADQKEEEILQMILADLEAQDV